MKAPTCRVERGSVVATKAFKASSCTALKKLALPPTAKLVSPSMPRCSNNLCQPRIESSFNKNAAAISWQLHPSSSSTKAFARRVRRDAAEPSRANAIRCLRSSALRKPPRIMPHPNPPIRERQGISPDSSMSQGISKKIIYKQWLPHGDRIAGVGEPSWPIGRVVGLAAGTIAREDARGPRKNLLDGFHFVRRQRQLMRIEAAGGRVVQEFV